MAEGSRFCTQCGALVVQNEPKQEPDQIERKILKDYRILVRVVIIAVVITGIIGMVSYFNSASYLEKRLTSETWYEARYTSNYGSVMKFYLNGKTEVQRYVWWEDEWRGDGRDRPNWEIMEDKTLVFDGDYYEWNTEWFLQGNRLRIDDEVYSSSNNYGYKEK